MKLTFANLLLLVLLCAHDNMFAQNTCASADVIGAVPYSRTGLTTCGKANDYTATSSCSGPYMGGEDYVFKYTPSANGCLNIALTGTSNYTGLFVLDACPNAATSANCVKYAEATGGNPSLTGISVTAGKTYYIIVDTWPSPNCTPFNINIQNCPAGSTCSSAIAIPSLPYQSNNTTCGGGADYGSIAGTDYNTNCRPNFNDDGEDIVYEYTAPRSQCVNISVTGWAYPGDGAFTVTSYCPGDPRTSCLAVREGSGNTAPAPANGLQLYEGEKIYIIIDADDFRATCTPFSLSVDTCANVTLPNCTTAKASDLCSSATPICDLSSYCGNTSNAYDNEKPGNLAPTFCGGPPNNISIDNNSWISFVAGATNVTFTLTSSNCRSNRGIQAQIFQTSDCANFTTVSNCVNQNSPGTSTLNATGLTVGQTYYIMIDGAAGDICYYTLSANNGLILPVEAGPDQAICEGQSATLTATFGNGTYTWSPGNISSKTITVSPLTTTDYVVSSFSGNIGCPSPDKDTVRVVVSPAMTLSITGYTDPNCSGGCTGTATVSISGGTAPFTYSWAHGPTTASITGLCPGTTYTATVTDAVGCPKTISLTTPPLLTAAYTFTTPACGSLSTPISTAATSGTGVFTYTGPGSMSFSNTGANAYTATATAYGTYDVTWTVTSGSCSKTVTKSITFTEQPVAAYTPATPACGALLTDLSVSASAGSGAWTATGPGSAAFNMVSPGTYRVTVSAYGTYNLTWTVTNGPCSAAITKSVTFTEQPVANFSRTGPACNSLSFVAAPAASAGSAVWTYSGPGSLTFSPSGSQYNVSATAFGQYTVTLTRTNGPCTDSYTTTISFDKQPAANAGLDQGICGQSSTLAAIPSVGNGLWSQLSGPSTASVADAGKYNSGLSVGTYGTYIFRWTETNGSVCPPSNDTVTINFYQQPNGNAGPDQQVCALSTTLAGAVTVGAGTWSGPGVVNPSNPNTTVNVLSGGTRKYFWTISNGTCPSLVDSTIVEFYKKPTPEAGTEQSVCGLACKLDASSPLNLGEWVGPADASFINRSDNKDSAFVASYGSYYFVWEERNGVCPPQRDSVRINFIEEPQPNAGNDSIVCGLSCPLNAMATPYSGNWSGTGSFEDAAKRSSTVTAPGYGTYTYTWTEFNQAPCPSKADQVRITFMEPAVAFAGNDTAVCGLSGQLNALPSVAGSTGNWSLPAGTSVNAPTSSQSAVTAASYGSYTFIWTEENGNVCPSSADEVTIQFVSPTSPFAGPDDSICGAATVLAAVTSFGTGAWSSTGPGVLSFADPSNPSSAVNASAYGAYRVVWTENNSPCPANADTAKIHFFEPPVAEAGPDEIRVCGLDTSLLATIKAGSGQWTWEALPGTAGNIIFGPMAEYSPSPAVSATDHGQYLLTWTVGNGPCELQKDSIALFFFEKPQPLAGPDLDLCDTLSAQLSGLTSVAGISSWSSAETGIVYMPDSLRPDPLITVAAPGTYHFFFYESNDPVCGIQTDTLEAIFREQPSADAGPDANACGNSYGLQGNLPIGTGAWSVTSVSAAGYSINFDDINAHGAVATITPSPPAAGVTVTLRWSIVNGPSCDPVFDETDITFRDVPNSVDAGPNLTVCDSLAATLNANDFGGTGTWLLKNAPSGAAISFDDATQEITKLTVNKYGLYQLERNVQVAGCPNGVMDIVLIDFRALPTPFAGNDTMLCGSTVKMSGAKPTDRATGNWTVLSGPGSLQFSNSASPLSQVSLGDNTFGTYIIQWEEINMGCPPVADQVSLVFLQQPVAKSDSSTAVCDLTHQLQAQPSASGPYYSGNWTIVSGAGPASLSPAGGSDPNSLISATTYGIYTLQWEEKNGVCPASLKQINVQFVTSTPPDAGPDDTFCGLIGQLSAVPSFSSGFWRESGNPGTVLFQDTAAPATTLSVSNYGKYTFEWLEDHSPCVSNSDFTELSFYQQPVASAGPDEDICGPIYKLKAAPSVSSDSYTGTWTGPAGSVFSDIHDPNATVDVAGVGFGEKTFFWSEVNGSKCAAATDLVKINFLQQPVANAGSYPASVCGKSLVLGALPSAGTGLWTASGPGNVTFSNAALPSATAVVTQFGSYTFSWTETVIGKHGLTCSSTASFSIEFVQQPTANPGPSLTTCGEYIDLKGARSVAGSAVKWSFSGNPADLALVNDSLPNASAILTGTHNTYSLQFTETVRNTCSSTAQVQITFVQPPHADAGPADTTCGQNYVLTAAPSPGNGWWQSFSPGVEFTPGIASTTPAVKVPGYGTYGFVRMQETDLPCSTAADTVFITFLETPRADAGLDLDFCGRNAVLNARPSVGNGMWSYQGSKNLVLSNPSSPQSPVQLIPANAADYGPVQLTWTETNGGLCSSLDYVVIHFHEVPQANAGPDNEVCGRTYTFSGQSAGGAGKWIYPGDPADLGSFTGTETPSAQVSMTTYGTYRFTWIVSNGPVCPEDSDEVILTFIESPSAYAGGDTVICGLSDKLDAVTGAGSGLWSQVSGPAVASLTAPTDPHTDVRVPEEGIYNFRWTQNNGNYCPPVADEVSVTFTREPAPIAGTDQTVCGNAIQLSATPSVGTGKWKFLGDNSAQPSFTDNSDPAATLTIQQFGTYTLEWSEINSEVCGIRVDTLQVTFLEQPHANAGASPVDVCGILHTLQAIPSAGQGVWSQVSGPGTASFSDPQQANAEVRIPLNSAGSYVFRWTEHSGAPCQADSSDVVVNFYQVPVSNAGEDAEACGLSFDLGALPSAGTGTWSLVVSGTQQAQFDDPSSPVSHVNVNEFGVYEFIWSESNGADCASDEDRVTVRFFEPPVADAGADDTICGAKYTLQAAPSVGSGLWTQVSGPGTVVLDNASDANSPATASAYGTYVFRWQETNGTACPPADDEVEIRFIELPVASLSGDYEVCRGSSLGLPVQLSGNGPFAVNFSDGSSQDYPSEGTQTFTVTPTANSTYSIARITDAYGCEAGGNGNASVVINELPDGTLSPVRDKICEGDTIDLVITSNSPHSPWQIYLNGGTRKETITSSGKSIMDVPLAGLALYSLDSIRDSKGCVGVGNAASVLVHALPSLNIDATYTICSGTEAVIRPWFSPSQGGPWSLTYRDGNQVIDLPPMSSPGFFTLTPATTTTYTLEKLVDQSTGCSNALQLLLKVNVIPTPALSATCPDNEICRNQPVTLRFIYAGPEPADIVLNDGNADTLITGIRNGTAIELYPQGNAIYTVKELKYAVGTNCEPDINVSIPVIVNPLPVVMFDAAGTKSCAPSATKFHNGTDPAMVGSGGVFWTFGDGSTSVENDPEVSYLAPGTYDVGLQVTSPAGCTDSLKKSAFVEIYPDPAAIFSFTPELPTVLENELMIQNSSENASAYRWTLEDVAYSTDREPLIVLPADDSATYTVCLEALSGEGCRDTVCRTINIKGEFLIYVPNAFTPNNDDVNDKFMPSIQGAQADQYLFQIFDRWGQLIFHTHDLKEGWDGTMAGLPAKNDHYTWKIEVKGKFSIERYKYFGSFTLLR